MLGWQIRPDEVTSSNGDTTQGLVAEPRQHLQRQTQQDDFDEADEQAETWIVPPTKAAAANTTLDETSATSCTSFFDASRKPQSRFAIARSAEDQLSQGERGKQDIFSKAANIIREAFNVEGCVFYDVTMGSYMVPEANRSYDGNDKARQSDPTSSGSGSDDLLPISPTEHIDAVCDVLGFSTTALSSIKSSKAVRLGKQMSKRFLAKLLRRYPEGKIFNFDASGELQSDDSSDDNPDAVHSAEEASIAANDVDIHGPVPSDNPTKRINKSSRDAKEAKQIYAYFPQAHSVAFLPIWDSKRERWFASSFLYSLTPLRVFTVEDELSLLKAFCNSVTVQVHRLEMLMDSNAKSDALGSLSHELRSPLHGILLSTELLNDAELDAIQENAIHTIEICCRTLLDTIDHLLDYAKVNSFATESTRDATGMSPAFQRTALSNNLGIKKLHRHTSLDRLVEEVVEAVFSGFNFQRMSIRQLSKQKPSTPYSDAVAIRRADQAQAMEQLLPGFNGDARGDTKVARPPGDVSVFVLIDPASNWTYHLPPGALRRVIMNLIANSLKFTSKGSILVSLSEELAPTRLAPAQHHVKLVVQDTGMGMSREYLQHRLYKPFAQEDELSPGTGLGLSIVKRIVASLRGQIMVESQVGVGTTITVTLPLEQSAPATGLSAEDKLFQEQVEELRGMRVRIDGVASEEAPKIDRLALVEDICRNTLHLEIVSGDPAQEVRPDVVLWVENMLPEALDDLQKRATAPNVVICQDALVAYERSVAYEAAGQKGVFEFVSQP